MIHSLRIWIFTSAIILISLDYGFWCCSGEDSVWFVLRCVMLFVGTSTTGDQTLLSLNCLGQGKPSFDYFQLNATFVFDRLGRVMDRCSLLLLSRFLCLDICTTKLCVALPRILIMVFLLSLFLIVSKHIDFSRREIAIVRLFFLALVSISIDLSAPRLRSVEFRFL